MSIEELERGVHLVLDHYLIYDKMTNRLFTHQTQFEQMELSLLSLLNEAYQAGYDNAYEGPV